MEPIRDQEDRLAAIYAARRRGTSTPTDVSLGDVDLDAEARAAIEAQAQAEADARAAAEAEAAAEAAADGPAEMPPLDMPPPEPINGQLPDDVDAAADAAEADGIPLRPLPRS